MIHRYAGAVLGLAVSLVCGSAWAQKVVILELEGDRGDRVRTQIVRELSRDGAVEMLGVADFKRTAAASGFKGARAMTGEAVAAISGPLAIIAALDGEVGKKAFRFQILDALGAELFAREVPLVRGRLSPRDAKRIASAVAAAAKAKPRPVVEPAAAVVAAEAAAEPSEIEALTDAQTRFDPVSPEEKDFDVVRPGRRDAVGPKLLTLHLGGTTTWRAYCSRPSVTACKDYDAMPREGRPAGDTVNFSPQVPYAGFGLGLDFFPLWSLESFVRGFGLSVGYSRGFSLTNVRVETPDGATSPGKQVVSLDDAWHALATWRYYFGMGAGQPLPAYVGVRAGLSARTFEVDPSAAVPLPGSHRRYPTVGIDMSVPVVKFFRIEAAGTYFVDPQPGVDELAGYGAGATGQGFSAEAGIAGDLWGPLGYKLRFRWMSYRDRFTGAGSKWTEGGAAEESYSGLDWGLTASF